MWLVSGALLVAFASYVALPVGLALYLPRLAAQHGIHLDVERVRVEPFGSRLRLSGARIATAGDSSIEWSSVEARIDLAELLSGRLVLDGFRLSEAKLHTGDPRADVNGVLPDVPAALPEEVSVGELVIDDVEFTTASEALGRPVAVDWLRISSLDDAFRPEGAEVQADLSVGEGRSRLQGRLNLDAAGWILNAGIDASGVPLDGLPALPGAGGSWRGRLDGSGPVRFVYAPGSGAFSATAGGRWAVDGLELGLAGALISGARADWDGTAFMTFSGDAVETLSVDGEMGLREVRVDVAGVLQVETAELMLRIDASQAPEPRLSVEGRSPALRVSGKGGAFEALGAEATNLVSLVALTIADDIGVEVDRLTSHALTARLANGRTVDIEQLEIERAVVESGTNAVSAAAATAERVDWRGVTAPRSTGTATRLAMRGIERHGNGGFRIALASAETVEDRNGDSDLRLHGVAFESATLSPPGAVAAGGVRVSDARLASEAGTLVLEQLSLDGVERDAGGAVSIASGRARVADHALAGRRTIVGSELAFTGAAVSGRRWEAVHARLGRAEVETGAASYALRELVLVDAAGEGEGGTARLARLGRLEHGSGANRVVLEDLHAESPAWRDGAGDARTVEVASIALDAGGGHRWRSSGWRLTGVETAASGRTGAATASLESLGLSTADGSTADARRIELDGLTFDGGSTARAASAFAGRTHYRAGDGSGIDVTGLRADALEWNGETLAAEHGAARRLSVAAAPVHASFDTVAFTAARLGAGGMHRLGTLTSASGRGGVDLVLEWSAGALALGGYHAPASGTAMLEFVETRDVDVLGDANEGRLRVGRLTAREARIDPSGAVVFAAAEAVGVTLDGAHGRAGTSVRALRANPLAIRESEVEIGALSLSGLEGTIGLSENGDWELPALPTGAGDTRSSPRVRIGEAGTADAGSFIRIVDRTTAPDFTARVDISSAALHGFDSGAVDAPARFSLDANADVFTALRAGGGLTPTLTGTDLDLNATIRGLSLRELSPYARLHLGRQVEGGRADVTLDVTVRTSDLEGVADFTLSDIVLGQAELPADSPLPDPVDPSLLGAALDRLEDGQGRVALKVPLRGKLDAPGFDFDGLVVRALADAALEAAGALPKAE